MIYPLSVLQTELCSWTYLWYITDSFVSGPWSHPLTILVFAGNKNNHEVSHEFKIWQDQTMVCGVSCSWTSEKIFYLHVLENYPKYFYDMLACRWAIIALWATCYGCFFFFFCFCFFFGGGGGGALLFLAISMGYFFFNWALLFVFYNEIYPNTHQHNYKARWIRYVRWMNFGVLLKFQVFFFVCSKYPIFLGLVCQTRCFWRYRANAGAEPM